MASVIFLGGLGAASRETPALAEHDPTSGVEILRAGDFHAKEVKADSGDLWLVLYKRNGEYRTEVRPIHIEACQDMGDSPGQKTGRRVASDLEGEVLIFVKGLPATRSGSVKTALDAAVRLYPGQERTVRMPGGEWAHFAAMGRVVEVKPDDEHILRCIADYKIAYSRAPDDLHWQYLELPVKDCESGPASVEWAGDLDGDSHVDLLIRCDGFNSSEWILYLSSAAKPPDQLKRVASAVYVGC